MKNWQSGERVQYEYDSLKRLKKAWTTEAQAGFGTWGVNYSYDGFGNLEQQTPVAGMQNAPPSLYVTMTPASRAKNQMAGGASYDGNGNLTNSAQHGTLEYDVDNRLERVVASDERYGYGGGNLRRWRTKAGQTAANSEIYFYGLSGELVATFKVTGCTTAYGCGGQPLYMTLQSEENVVPKSLQHNRDRLGNVMFSGVTRYLPYGELYPGTVSDVDAFGTYRRDSGTGLDYAVNRYYSSGVNRFMTADPYQARSSTLNDPFDPATWNRYSYVLADPLRYHDPAGTNAVEYSDRPVEGASSGAPSAFPGISGFDFISAFVAPKLEKKAKEWVIAAIVAATVAQAIRNSQSRLVPTTLRVMDDCYVVHPDNVWERHMSYRLFGTRNGTTIEPYDRARVDEEVHGDEPISGAVSRGNSRPGWFLDEHLASFRAIGLGGRDQLIQRFRVTTFDGLFRDHPVSVTGFGGIYGVLSIIKSRTSTWINGNSGTVLRNGEEVPAKICGK
jgi:RHS repeat-associated protein